MADVSPSALPPEADLTPEPPISPDIVGKLQAQGEAGYQGAVERGNALAADRIAGAGAPPPPSAAEVAAPEFKPNQPPPPQPTKAEAAAPAGTKAAKPVKVTQPTAEERAKADQEPNLWGFTKALFTGSVPEVTQAPARMGAETGQLVVRGAAGVTNMAERLWDGITGKEQGTTHAASDAIFDFDKNYVKPAIEHWTPTKGSFVGDEGSSAVAQGMGGAAEMLTYGRYGPAGVAGFLTNAFSKSAYDKIDEGMDPKDAFTGAAIDAAGAAAQMMIIGKDALGKFAKGVPTALIRRVLTGIGAGDLISMGTDLTKKAALEATGNHKAAEKIDVTQHVTNLEEAVQNAVYAAVFPNRAHDQARVPGAPPPPPAVVTKAPETKSTKEPPPPPAEAAVAHAPAQEIPHSPVPDAPSAEPAKQIRAQLIDMNRSNTPRQGVLISPETKAHIDGLPDGHPHGDAVTNQVEQARAQGRVVDTPAGELVVKTKAVAVSAKSQLKAGVDPQTVVGRITGAGEGKSPDQTVVIQGREITDGSITAEKAVRPDQKGAAKQAMLDQGKIPVEVTPEGVLAERHVGVTEEKQKATEKSAAEPKPITEAPPEPKAVTEPAPLPIEAPKEIAAPAPSEAAVSEPKAPEKPREGMFKTDSGKEVPVHIAGEPIEGKLTVHPLNEEGEPGAGVQVPAERVRTGTEKAPEVTNEEVANPTRGTALDQLPAALAVHQKQEAAPAGRKNPAGLKERQDNASSFAAVLRQAAAESHAKGGQESAVGRATEAAKRAEGLTNKSKEATEKGQGTSHAIVTARVSEMHKAARELMGKAEPGDKERMLERKPIKLAKPLTSAAEQLLHIKRKALEEGARERVAKAEQEHEIQESMKKTAAKEGVPLAEVQARRVAGKKVLGAVLGAKPVVVGGAEAIKYKRLQMRYLEETDPEKARAARDELEAHIVDVAERMGQPNPREAATSILNFLSTQRAESGKRETGRMSDTIEDEEQEFDRPKEGFSTVYRPSRGGKGAFLDFAHTTLVVKRSMSDLGKALGEHGFFDRMVRRQDTGESVSYHSILDEMLKHAPAALADHIRALREVAPDVPVFSRSTIINPVTRGRFSADTRGLFHANMRQLQPEFARQLGISEMATPSMQVQFQDQVGHSVGQIVHTIIHEGWHAATNYELINNPQGRFAAEMNNALEILRERLRSQYPDVDRHIEYFNNAKAEKPTDINYNLYGLTNASEMVAELARPEFVQMIIDSEMFAKSGENVPAVRGIPGLLAKVLGALARMMGVKEPRLLLHIVDATMRGAADQRANPRFKNMYGPESGELLKTLVPPSHLKALAMPTPEGFDTSNLSAMRGKQELEDMFRPAPTVKAEGQMSAMMGSDEAVKAARDNLHVIRSKAVDMARNTVIALKTVGQIFRDNVKNFGHDDDTNPINQLRDVMGSKNKLLQEMRKVSNPVARDWMRLSAKDNIDVSQLMIDTTQYKIDPRQGAKIPTEAQARPGFAARLAEYQSRYSSLSDAARKVYDNATDTNKKLRGMERRAATDAALEGFGVTLSPEQKQLLYGAKDPGAFDRLIGEGKLVDAGDKNEKLSTALKEWIGPEMEGPYHHLGRHGEYVVQATPEGTKEFGNNKAKAEEFAARAKEMSPNSKAVAEERGGQWVVDYKVQHVSMHESRAEAEKAQKVLTDSGFDAGRVTKKTYDRDQAAALSTGMRELMTESIRKINRSGQDKGTEALVDSLHSAFLQMQAQRSAYAGSRLTRKNVGGVKAKDMRRNFAEHASSSIWHAAQIRTVFQQAAAMARLREMAKADDALQATVYRRGEVVSALNGHAANEVQSMGKSGNFNARMAKLGFLSYLTSPAHAAIWLTQNFTTGVPWAGARYGYGRSTAAFAKGMAATTGPAMKSFMREVISRGGSGDEIHAAVVRAVAAHPEMGKWADAIRQLGERGVISHGYANELAEMARGTSPASTRVMEWARLSPAMADAINRTSTALAGLELTGGDLRKASDMVEAIHADYSAGNKPLAFKALGRIPGANSITTFKTYAQEMIHLTYGNMIAAMKGLAPGGDRQAAWIGAKTVAGLMVGNAMFAGVYGAVGLEPMRMMLYAYHKLFDEEGEVWDLKNTIHHFLVDHFGVGVGNSLARGPIADALGVDVQSRMGLSDLFFHDPPDLMTSDKTVWSTFIANELGPQVQMIANNVTTATGHIQNGDYGQAMAGLVPVKMWQDGLKALQLMTTGKETGRGAALTQPSALDAAKQLFGLKPASVADVQERQGIKAEYSKTQGMVKSAIVRRILEAEAGSPEEAEAEARRERFNERNPGNEIKASDIARAQRSNLKIEENVPSRNQRAEEAADFSGT